MKRTKTQGVYFEVVSRENLGSSGRAAAVAALLQNKSKKNKILPHHLISHSQSLILTSPRSINLALMSFARVIKASSTPIFDFAEA
jgi:hypothetical protein